MNGSIRKASLVGLALALGVAWAGDVTADRWEHDERRRGWRHDTYRGVPRYYHDAQPSRRERADVYYCAACRHRFDSRVRFRGHLHHAHHVPLWQIPFVIVHGVVHGVLGWVFYG